jgi:hypothetical protein
MSELTPAQQQELHELREALQSEWAESEETRTTKSAKKDIEDLKGDMLDALERTLKHGTLEQQSKVAMWGYGKLLDEGKADNDPIRMLIQGMPAPTPVEPTKEDEDADVGVTSPEAIAKATDIPFDRLAPGDESDDGA